MIINRTWILTWIPMHPFSQQALNLLSNKSGFIGIKMRESSDGCFK